MSKPAPTGDFASVIRVTSYYFCQALLSDSTPEHILSTYFSDNPDITPRITEHGPSWAQSRLPFLGKTFEGKDDCLEYFKLLSDTLKMETSEDVFPPAVEIIADGETRTSTGEGAVSVVGKAKWTSVKSGKSWDEQFIYKLTDFDNSGRIGHWEIWADPLSAYEAVGSD